MKYLISYFLIVLGFGVFLSYACTNSAANEVEPRNNPPRTAVGFTYRGHQYIGFGWTSGYSGVVHDPDCKKCKK